MDGSGGLLLYDDKEMQVIAPQPGLFLFFSPWMEHEVTLNLSEQVHLSLAFNFGLT